MISNFRETGETTKRPFALVVCKISKPQLDQDAKTVLDSVSLALVPNCRRMNPQLLEMYWMNPQLLEMYFLSNMKLLKSWS